jgi:rhamnosyltransferase
MSRVEVRVLMSVYYPDEGFLRDQLSSLKAQEGVLVALSVRFDFDDEEEVGRVFDVISEYFPNFECFCGVNLGASDSFMQLVSDCKDDADYYAFCDQDDVWSVEKLCSAIDLLTCNQKEVYASCVKVVNRNLEYLFSSSVPRVISFRNSLVENVLTGCTIVFTNFFRKELLEYIPSKGALVMHDSWVYQLSMYRDSLIFDERCFISYRQHGGNEVGMRGEFSELVIRALRFKVFKSSPSFYTQAEQMKLYADLTRNKFFNRRKVSVLDRYLEGRSSLRKRIMFVLGGLYSRNGFLGFFIYLSLYLMGR